MDLKGEQARIQFEKGKETERNRTLQEYSLAFGRPSTWLSEQIIELCKTQSGCVYADLACGNGVALRLAKKEAQRAGMPKRIETFGIDALETDTDDIKQLMTALPGQLPPDLLDPSYDPIFIEGDIETARLPKQPNLTTICEAIYYTRNPLEVLLNALAQTDNQGLVCVNGLSRLHLTSSPDPANGTDAGKIFGKYLDSNNGRLNGFTLPYLTNKDLRSPGPDTLVFKKTSPTYDRKKISAQLGFAKYRLVTTATSRTEGGSYYFYYVSE